MFGDLGHGIILLLISLYYVRNEAWFENRKIGEMESNLYYGRYIMVLMALFSIYTGLLYVSLCLAHIALWVRHSHPVSHRYNECFSVPLDLFGTNWKLPEGATEAVQLTPGFPYIFGVDPAWRGTRNELSYFNSLKMKASVMYGLSIALPAQTHAHARYKPTHRHII